jgi:hypothetical protein
MDQRLWSIILAKCQLTETERTPCLLKALAAVVALAVDQAASSRHQRVAVAAVMEATLLLITAEFCKRAAVTREVLRRKASAEAAAMEAVPAGWWRLQATAVELGRVVMFPSIMRDKYLPTVWALMQFSPKALVAVVARERHLAGLWQSRAAAAVERGSAAL